MIVNVGDVVVFAVGMKPESNPVWPLVLETPRGVHGSANELCVAVWFLSRNWNVTVSPMFADNVFGEYASAPSPPTITTRAVLLLLADAAALDALVVAAVVVTAADVAVVVAAAESVDAGAVTVAESVAAAEVDADALPMALDWKRPKLLPGLMANTMPCWQWPVWRQ